MYNGSSRVDSVDQLIWNLAVHFLTYEYGKLISKNVGISYCGITHWLIPIEKLYGIGKNI